jgi:hypothetical protein
MCIYVYNVTYTNVKYIECYIYVNSTCRYEHARWGAGDIAPLPQTRQLRLQHDGIIRQDKFDYCP